MESRALRLTVSSGPQAGTSLGLPDEEVVRIGSSRACQLVLEAEGILKVHCFLKCSGGRCLLIVHDKNATVLVNGEETRRKLLAPGDVLEIGGVSLALEVFREDPLVGKTLGGYRVEKLLGKGSMGSVYRATQLSLQREVALKVLSPELTKDESFVQEFLKEARAAAKLNHPNVVQVIDAAREGDAFFFSMEFLPGGTLAQRLEEQGRLSLETALRVACDTARALAWAQENKIVHRDIKPDNLLFAADGTVKVADLGIAADLLGASKEGAGRSVGLGSPRYMAPEQALRRPVDHRADIYSLGCALYRMIAGRAPFEGKTAAEIVRAKTTKEAVPLSRVVRGVPERLSAMVQAMLAREPENRPPSSSDVLAKLEECLAAVEKGSGAEVDGGRRARPSRSAASAPWSSASSWITTLWRTTYGRVALAASGLLVLGALVIALTWRPPASAPMGGGRSPDSGAEVAKGVPQPPEPTAPEKEKGPPGKSPGVGPDTALPAGDRDPKLEAALRELGEIHRDHVFDPRKSLADLEAFRRKHPEAELAHSVDRLRAQIQETLREEARIALGKAVKEVEPLLRASEFNEATGKLLGLKEKYPENLEEIDGKIREVSDAAESHWKSLQEQVGKLLEAADFAGAAGALDGLQKKYPFGLHGAVEFKAAEVKLAQEEHVQGCRTMDEVLAKIRSALSELDFDGAASLAAGIPEYKSPLLAGRKASLSSEVGLSKAAWEKVRTGLSAIVQSGTAVALAFEPEPARTEGSYRIVGLEGVTLKVQKEKGSSVEEKPVLTLAVKNLAGLLAADSGTEPEKGEPPVELLEGLGLLILHVGGPARAKELLEDARLGPEKVQAYRARIESETPAFLARLVAGEAARVEKLSAAAALEGATISAKLLSEANGLSADIGRAMALHRAMAGYEEFKRDLAWLFLQARAVALRTSAPQCFFKGKVDSSRADGTVKIVYDFKTEEELQDFVPVHSGSGIQLYADKKQVAIKGEIRLGRGDIFRNKLSVTARVPPGGYTVSSPNINVALWTRDHDAVTPLGRPVDSEARSADMVDAAGNDFIVFGIGYRAQAYGSADLTPRGSTQAIPMPANALFLGARGLPLHSSRAKDDCLWAAPRPQSSARQNFSVEMNLDSPPRWTVNQSRVIPDQDSRKIDLAAIQRPKVRVGSVTFFTNGQMVDLDHLSVEGELNPAWLEVALLRRAEEDLEEVEPNFPFRKETDSRTESEKTSRWPDLVANCHELRSLQESMAREPQVSLERDCGSVLQRMVRGLTEGAPAALASRVRRSAMEATSIIAPDNVEFWAEVAQITMLAGDVEGACRLLEKKIRTAGSGDSTVGILRLSRLRRLLLRHVDSYASIEANLAAPEAIVPEGATWRYFPGERRPSAGLEWTRITFDDSSWKEGESGLGYGDDDLKTILEDMRDKYRTVFVRRKFRLPDPCPWNALILSVTADDGFVAYLNGIEVGRARAPGSTGREVRHDEWATDRAPEPEPTTEIRLDPKQMLRGDNVLAIQGLNVRDSSDFVLTPCLHGEAPPGPAGDRRRFGNLLSRGEGAVKMPAPAHLHSYLEGRLLERAGEHAAAAREFRKVLQADRSRPEPFLRLAESMRGAGDAAGAEGVLREAIGSGIEDSEPLWERWFTLSTVDLKKEAGDILASFPSEKAPQKPSRKAEEKTPVRSSEKVHEKLSEKATGKGSEATPEGASEKTSEIRSASSNYARDLRHALEQVVRGETIRIDCGSTVESQDLGGESWERDRFHRGGGRSRAAFPDEIRETKNSEIYRTARWFPAVGGVSGYRIPLPRGEYGVTLHFAEVWEPANKPGVRRFDVRLEGKTVLSDYDATGRVGFATADPCRLTVPVEDGNLDVDLVPKLENPSISAIEIRRSN